MMKAICVVAPSTTSVNSVFTPSSISVAKPNWPSGSDPKRPAYAVVNPSRCKSDHRCSSLPSGRLHVFHEPHLCVEGRILRNYNQMIDSVKAKADCVEGFVVGSVSGNRIDDRKAYNNWMKKRKNSAQSLNLELCTLTFAAITVPMASFDPTATAKYKAPKYKALSDL